MAEHDHRVAVLEELVGDELELVPGSHGLLKNLDRLVLALVGAARAGSTYPRRTPGSSRGHRPIHAARLRASWSKAADRRGRAAWYRFGTDCGVRCVPEVVGRGRRGRTRTHRHSGYTGWGPGGRRFKSCLPDSTRRLQCPALHATRVGQPLASRPSAGMSMWRWLARGTASARTDRRDRQPGVSAASARKGQAARPPASVAR
jgi:hypothetical protein